MKILFVYPKFRKYLETNPNILKAIGAPVYAEYKAMPSLGIPILTALTPDEHELHFADGNLEDIPYDEDFDLVAINSFTPQAKYAYEVADKFRARGIPVILGGIFPSNYREDCSKHADAVFVGEAELGWHEVLADAQRGQLKPIYNAGCNFDVEKYVIPDRRLFKHKKGYDWRPLLLQNFRGCQFNCAYCAISATNGKKMRMRPIDNIMQEIEENMDLDGIYIGDDQFLLPDPEIEKHSLEFFSRLKELNYQKSILLSASPLLNKNPKLLQLIRDCGVNTLYFVFGWDPVAIRALSYNDPHDAEESIKAVQDAGFNIFASIGVGQDADTPEIFPRTIDFLERNQINHAEFWIQTPFPGTPAWRKYKKTGRILTEDFDMYNGAHVVYQPKKMSVQELEDGFIYLWQEFFTRFNLPPEEVLQFYSMSSDFKSKVGIQDQNDEQKEDQGKQELAI
ncbi:radical SAM protein [Dehalobacterium formicoaceticum]|uniref:Radical SAM protein n=1 Tax=Dehalobacterium formicoaceticum TaxID=51515 RepID=A0ABT1XZW6_9FIRM|nr:radical SAM protein [Dehalobacterium formicoaceticum]MCR6544158.1 radical SAM protein [Dehalobacterium formicoaceticum]